jgi:hypothetical protein
MKNVKHPNHTMLPVHLQNMLMSAAASGRSEVVDRAIKDVYETMPHKFHTEKTVSERRFLNEPRRIVPNAGYEVPFPLGGAARST